MYIQHHPCIDLHTSALCWHELATTPWHDDGARTAGSNVPRDKSTCLPLHTLVWRACCVCIHPNDETGEREGRKGLLRPKNIRTPIFVNSCLFFFWGVEDGEVCCTFSPVRHEEVPR